MKKPIFWEKAKKDLTKKDKKLGKIISTYPKDFLFSMQSTFRDNWAALIAATYPPGPPPITIKSYCFSLLINQTSFVLGFQ